MYDMKELFAVLIIFSFIIGILYAVHRLFKIFKSLFRHYFLRDRIKNKIFQRKHIISLLQGKVPPKVYKAGKTEWIDEVDCGVVQKRKAYLAAWDRFSRKIIIASDLTTLKEIRKFFLKNHKIDIHFVLFGVKGVNVPLN